MGSVKKVESDRLASRLPVFVLAKTATALLTTSTI
jgi:hypothetical protein